MQTFLKLSAILLASYVLSSCGTIVGGSRYTAHLLTRDRPEAKIYYNGNWIGTGGAIVELKRAHANRLSFLVKEDGCEDQTFTFNSRTFRGVPLVIDILWVLPSYLISGVSLITDLSTGSFWKPNKAERGITKLNYDNYQYTLDYLGCPEEKKKKEEQPQQDSVLIDHVYLKNGGIIKGTILEMVPNVQIKVETRDGSIFVYKMEEVEKMTKEKAVKKAF